jgi:hypothetical protein
MRNLFPFLAWKGNYLPALSLAASSAKEVGQAGVILNTQLQAKLAEIVAEYSRVSTEMEIRIASIDTTVASLEATASRRAEEQSVEQEEKIVQFVDVSNRMIAESKSRLEDDRAAFVKEMADTHTEASATLNELRRILSIASDDSLSANYGNRADSELKEATNARNKASKFGITTVVVAAASVAMQVLLPSLGHGSKAMELLPSKLALLAALGSLSAYWAKQSSHHRTVSLQMRTLQLELQNLGPYLAELSLDKRAETKRELVGRFFGNPSTVAPEVSPTSASNLKDVTEFVAALAKLKMP